MKKDGKLRAVGVGIFGCLLAAVCMVITFLPVLPKFSGLVAGDAMPFFQFPWRTLQIEELLSTGCFTPHALYRILLDPLWMHELTFIFDTFVLAGAGMYYLRAKGVHPLAALCGGLALGFSGYTFTLFSAGHRGYFHMFSCAVWSFGLIARGFERRSLFYFAMLGMVMAWGAPYQPDVLLFVGALAGAYALWLTFGGSLSTCAPEGGRGRAVKERICRVWPRFAVSLLFLGLSGFGGLRAAVTTQMAAREAQIAGVTGKKVADSASAQERAAERNRRWLFATNWSLPPEDVVEFVVPGVFGDESMQGDHPYWGRLGRPDDSEFQIGRMMPNYRQHTVYLGVVPVLLALLAVICWWRSRRDSACGALAESSGHPTPYLGQTLSDVPFWSVVWVICLVLAMGRYTPVYRAFYSIPFMDYIRAPVKFHHLVEIATAFLAGFGMDALLRGDRKRVWGRLSLVGMLAALVVTVLLLVAVVAKASMIRQITALGLGQFADSLSKYAISNVGRSLAIVIAVSVLAFLGSRLKGKAGVAAIALTGVAWLAADQACVARRYVKAMDLEPYYRPNMVIKALVKDAQSQGVSGPPDLISYVTQNTWQDWFSTAFGMNGIQNRAPSGNDQGKSYGALFSALESDPLKLWKVLHVQYVVAPHKGLNSLLKAGLVSPVLDFELDKRAVRQSLQAGDNTLTLARLRDCVIAPEFHTAWQGGVEVGRQVALLAGGGAAVSDAPSPSVGEQPDAKSKVIVSVLERRGTPGSLETRVHTESVAEGLLVFDERMSDKLEVSVDGHLVPLYTADGVWAAVRVPGGAHQVVLRQVRSLGALMISLASACVVVAWGLRVALSGRNSIA